MKRGVSIGLQVFALALVAFALGEGVWWSLWMNDGWPGPPNLLAHLLGADGEAAYDAQGDQMAVIVFIVLLIAWLAVRWYFQFRTRNGAADV